MDSDLSLTTHFTQQIDGTLRQQIVDLCCAAHGEDFSPLFSYLPFDGLHVLAWTGGRLAGHAVRTTRWAQPQGLPVMRTAYIDAVSTHPAAQGRGVGSAVMHRLAKAVAEEEYKLGCLETDRVSFYTRLGWEVWRGPLAGRGPKNLIPTPEAAGHVLVLRLPLTPPLNLDGLLTIEQTGRIW